MLLFYRTAKRGQSRPSNSPSRSGIATLSIFSTRKPTNKNSAFLTAKTIGRTIFCSFDRPHHLSPSRPAGLSVTFEREDRYMSMSQNTRTPIIFRAAAIASVLMFADAAAGQLPAGKDVPSLARDISPSVVRIVLRDKTGEELGSGSGFVIGSDGRVATNYHVIHMLGTTQAEARFTDGASYQVQGVLAIDTNRDLAVLKLQATGREFRPAHLGDSDQTQIGEHVLAIGSPLAGLSPVSTEATVSDGIVSGIRDWPDRQMKIFQITAPISHGSSGGALVNSSGDVVGVTFAQLVGGENLNFAIPISYLRSLHTDESMKSLTAINAEAADNNVKAEEIAPAGSYTGVWQSNKFSVSGAAQMTIRIADGTASAEIFLTGGEVTSAHLDGTAHRTGEDIWTIELGSKKPKLLVRGIFRGNSFVGDYSYSRFMMFDRGQWLLKKE